MTIFTQAGNVIVHPVIISTSTVFKCFLAANERVQPCHVNRVDGDQGQEGSHGDGDENGKDQNLILRWGTP